MTTATEMQVRSSQSGPGDVRGEEELSDHELLYYRPSSSSHGQDRTGSYSRLPRLPSHDPCLLGPNIAERSSSPASELPLGADQPPDKPHLDGCMSLKLVFLAALLLCLFCLSDLFLLPLQKLDLDNNKHCDPSTLIIDLLLLLPISFDKPKRVAQERKERGVWNLNSTARAATFALLHRFDLIRLRSEAEESESERASRPAYS